MFSRKKKIGLRALICAAALLGLLAAASPAVASRAFLEPFVTKYEADPLEANQVAISTPTNQEALSFDTSIEIDDPGAVDRFLEVGTGGTVERGNLIPLWPNFHHGGCKPIPDSAVYSTRAWCVVEEGQFKVSLRDEDDSFDMTSFPSASVRTAVSGGPGEDELIGGRATDLLYGDRDDDHIRFGGGAGADLLSGGLGRDTANYANRTVPITVTLPEPSPPAPNPPSSGTSPVEGITFETFGTANFVATPVAGDDGASGEGDDVQADIEEVDGGLAADTLVGSSTANELRGHGGDDYLDGGEGMDRLDGYAGTDHLKGYADKDWLFGDHGNDRLNGGSGDDEIVARDGQRDRIDCGSGSDNVYADPGDSFRDCNPEDIRSPNEQPPPYPF
jgi:hypothetical protein